MASKTKEDQIPSPNRIAVVTGGNKGIGLEICRQLASNGVRVILTARDEKRGLEAVEKLKQSGLSDVIFHRLDVTDHSSIDSLSEFIKSTFGKLDILVNNAAIAGATTDFEMLRSCIVNSKTREIPNIPTQETYKWAEECLDTNYYGVKRVTEALIPRLLSSESPRIVNVSSYFGKLQFIPNESVRKEMDDVDRLTEEKNDEMVRSFLNDFKVGDLTKNNWPTTYSSYIMSKAAMGAYTRIIAKKYPAICANCVHPGYVKTDINGNTGTMPVEEGAKGPVMAALLPHGSPSGLFYDKTEVSSFM
ncbi:(+)-neomenthol dehydrogenase-like isoform X2 [Ananas comosus]|uniref:Short-chain dehydrogenase/reductase n=1 Tax=Ananas comosus TaxID=4615 RepID=A0A6P5EL82_ANACO|nr:(+)-neomenthol dehydrogenase-like isoform X2 [Ananas comosus]